MLPFSHLSLKHIGLLGKRFGFPTFHSGGEDRNDINPSSLQASVSANSLKTLSSEQLAGSRHMLDVRKFIVVPASLPGESGTSDTQPGMFGKLVHEKGKIVL